MPEIFDGLSVIFFHNIAIAVFNAPRSISTICCCFQFGNSKENKDLLFKLFEGALYRFFATFRTFLCFFFSKGYIPVHPSIYSFCMKLILKVGIQTPGYFEAMRN